MPNPQIEYLRQFFPADISHTLLHYGTPDPVTGSNSPLLAREGWRCIRVEPGKSVSLTDTLRESRFPALFGLLILDTPGQQVLRSLDFEQFRPSMIILPEEADPEAGRRKYAFLATGGYRFAGVNGGESVWLSRAVQAPPAARLNPAFGQAVGSSYRGSSYGGSARPDSSHPSSSHPFTGAGQAISVGLDQPSAPPVGVIRVPWSGSLELEGWAFDSSNRGIESAVVLLFMGAETGTVESFRATRYARPDVALHFGDDALLLTGFHAAIPLQGRKPGRYSLDLLLVRNGETVGRADGILAVEPALTAYENAAREGLATRFLFGSGLEIGALQRRLPAPGGCTVKYIDRMPVAELLAHYPELAGMELQQPDLIDNGELLDTIADLSQDFVIANHFFEHSRNPIQTLFNLARVIRPGGVLYMAVPDKRYTKDLPRPITPYETLKQTYLTGTREELRELYREWAETWDAAVDKPVSDKVSALVERDYSIHFNVWDFESLMQFVLSTKTGFGLPFALTACVTAENEVILILTKTAS
ncbi:MAG: class I SAM-dependent methyltransferase [Acidobacteriota bacterium]|nr:class I SAM-dependent methyltransferase [Acidobacteriota bacterium]